MTIHRKYSVVQLADMGAPYDMDPFWIKVATSRAYSLPIFLDKWDLPKGAFGESCGPT